MRKKTLIGLVLTGLMIVFSAGTSTADVLTFEGLNDLAAIPNGYGGLNWSNMYALDGINYSSPDTGYTHGVISGNYVAYNAYGNMAVTSSSGNDFNFEGAWFTSAWYNNNTLTVEGYNNGSLVQSIQMVLNTAGPLWLNANLANIDELRFSTSDYQFAMDDFTYTPTPVPAAIYLLGAGLAGLAGLRRRKR